MNPFALSLHQKDYMGVDYSNFYDVIYHVSSPGLARVKKS